TAQRDLAEVETGADKLHGVEVGGAGERLALGYIVLSEREGRAVRAGEELDGLNAAQRNRVEVEAGGVDEQRVAAGAANDLCAGDEVGRIDHERRAAGVAGLKHFNAADSRAAQVEDGTGRLQGIGAAAAEDVARIQRIATDVSLVYDERRGA